MSLYSVDKLIAEARRIAADYRRATGKSLGGIRGEIAENDAARLLGLELCAEKPGGYDAIGHGAREGKKIQIKGRVLVEGKKLSGQRIGQLKLEQDWDSVVLVLMNEDYEPIEICEADRSVIMEAVATAKDNKRSKRGAMSVARFRAISQKVWPPEEETAAADTPDQEDKSQAG